MTATVGLEFHVESNRLPCPEAERAALLEQPAFGRVFTDHMVTIQYDEGRGWHSARLRPFTDLPMHPATAVLHYAQEVFEGLKAHRRDDGSVVLFRPEAHAARFNRSLRRMAMPELPEEVFIDSLRRLVVADADWVPTAEGTALYLRPYMIATDTALGAGRPSSSYLFVVIASPSGGYFGPAARPLDVWLSERYVRAAPGGTGAAKAGGNYAGALLGLREAAAHGCDQAVWLDAGERRWVEEAGAMNLFFVVGRGDSAVLVTPPLTDTFLPGITRDSILRLAPRLGVGADERPVSIQEWARTARAGSLTEVFACGTASLVVPVGEVRSRLDRWRIGGGIEGPVTARVRAALTDLQRGRVEDPFGWLLEVA